MKQALQQQLEAVRAELKCKRVTFSHAKFRYELEVPAEFVKGNRKPKAFEFTS